jgi:energy-coupling factor transport system permease protein
MHTFAWLSWVALVMTVALSTTNPLYLALVLLAILLVAALSPRGQHGLAGFRALATFGIGMLAVSVAISIINGSSGRHILFTIPGPHVPDWLGGLALGGPVSAEGLVAAAIRGLAILCVLLAFAVFNGAVSPQRVLRAAPAALFHAGLVVTVGLTLLPASIEDVRRIREMRALRGAPSGVRALPGLIVPAIIGGLERSMRLAEAMEARGYASSASTARWPQTIGALSAPLLLGAAGLWYYYDRFRVLAILLAIAGVAALVAWIALAARARRTTSLRQDPLGLLDRAGVAGSLGLLAFTIVGKQAGLVDLGYNPFAGLPAPDFRLAGGLVALACAWPALPLLFGTRPAIEEPAPAARAGVALSPIGAPVESRE